MSSAVGVSGLQAPPSTAVRARKKRLIERVRAISPLHANAYALALNTITGGVIGVLYWIIAARLYSATDVGRGAALISMMTLLASFAQLSLGSALLRFIPVAGNSVRKLVLSFYLAACAAGVVLGIPFVLVLTRHVGSLHRVLGSASLMGVIFCAAVLAWSIFALQDMVLTGLRRAHWVLVENQLFNVVKIALLVGFATLAPGTGIFASWLIPLPVAILAMNLLIFRRFLPRAAVRRRPPSTVNRRLIANFMRIDYIAVMLSLSTAYLMPLLVVARLGPSENAYFFVAWSVALALEGIVLSFATSLTVEGAANEEQLGEMALATLRRVYMFVLPLVGALVLLAPYVLALFGHEYASQSTTLLRLLAVSMLVRPVTSLVLATSRVRRRMSLVVRIELAAWVLLLGGSWFALGRWGISGVGGVVVVTQFALALCLLPTLRHDLRSGSPAMSEVPR